MDKIAQRRNWLNKLREKTNIGGKAMEVFSPTFLELMENLRTIDDEIREQAVDLKDILKTAKTNFNRREYMTAIAFLGRFHEKVEIIDNELSKLHGTVDKHHQEFLYGDVDPEHVDYITNKLSPRFEAKPNSKTAELERASLNKEAGLSDWWHNIHSDRGRTLSAWEKRFPRYAKELKTHTAQMINKSEAYLNGLLLTFKLLNTLRSTRKLEEYLKVSSKLREKYKSYNAAFTTFYNSQIKKFIDYQKAINRQVEIPGLTSSEVAKKVEKQLAPTISPESEEIVPEKPLDFTPEEFPILNKPEEKRDTIPASPPPANIEPIEISSDPFADNIPIDLKSKAPKVSIKDLLETSKSKKKANHTLFLQALGALENRHPMVIAKEIVIYANSIVESDRETSKNLLKIAKNILRG